MQGDPVALGGREVVAQIDGRAFGELRITAITESRVRQAITAWQDGGLSARRMNLVLLVLKMILRTALRRRLLREDPLVAVRMLREPRTEIDPLAPDELEAFLAACAPWWRPYFTVAFWTGARPNELAALRWGGRRLVGVDLSDHGRPLPRGGAGPEDGRQRARRRPLAPGGRCPTQSEGPAVGRPPQGRPGRP